MWKATLCMLPGFICLLLGCASSQEKSTHTGDYQNLVELTPPPEQGSEQSVIYIDSINAIDHAGEPALLITGTFPDGCTMIGRASHQTTDDTLSLTLAPWRKSDQMCTQALVTFSFIYRDIPPRKLRESTSLKINGTTYPINQ